MILLRFCLLSFGVALLIITAGVSAARHQDGTHAMIAYTAPDGIRRMWADGRVIDSLTPAADWLPSWSPDGRWIVYSRYLSPTQDELRIMRSGGGDDHALSGVDLEYNLAVRWSPDSERFLVIGGDRDGQKVYAAAPQDHLLTPLLPITGNHRQPNWSPDGEALVLAVTRGQKLIIYRTDADGGNLQPLTSEEAINYDPQWTKDGEWIIYTSSTHQNIDLYRMRPDGSEAQALTSTSEPEHYPNLSPDGQWVLYLVNSGVETIPYLMRPDGRDRHPLSADWNVPVPLDIAWSPDSQWITFTEAGGLFRIRVDGSGLQQLTRRDTCCISWSPLINMRLWGVALVGIGLLCIVGGVFRKVI